MISEFNPRRNRVIGDRRQLLVAERAENRKNCLQRSMLVIEWKELLRTLQISEHSSILEE